MGNCFDAFKEVTDNKEEAKTAVAEMRETQEKLTKAQEDKEMKEERKILTYEVTETADGRYRMEATVSKKEIQGALELLTMYLQSEAKEDRLEKKGKAGIALMEKLTKLLG